MIGVVSLHTHAACFSVSVALDDFAALNHLVVLVGFDFQFVVLDGTAVSCASQLCMLCLFVELDGLRFPVCETEPTLFCSICCTFSLLCSLFAVCVCRLLLFLDQSYQSANKRHTSEAPTAGSRLSVYSINIED